MGKKVLIIGAGSVQATGIRRAKEMGCTVIATDGNPRAPGLAHADMAVVIDVKDIPRTVALAKKQRIDGVLCIAVEAAVKTVAAVASEMGLPGLSPEAAEKATNKGLMRKFWALEGVPSPSSFGCRSLQDAQHASSDVGLPVVVKPADNAGSRGVSFVDRPEDLPQAYKKALSCSESGLVLIEAFMAGVEMSVEAFSYKGKIHILALSDKMRTSPPSLLDMTVLFPSSQPAHVQRGVERIAEAAIVALGIDMSPVHAEVMVTPRGPMMVELAARGPGFKVFTDMIPWVTGVDVVRELIKVSLGEEPDFSIRYNRGSVLRFPEVLPGRVRAVEGLDAARRLEGILDLDIYVQPGEMVRPLASGSDRIGHIIAVADTRKKAQEIVDQAERMLKVEVVADR